MLGDRCLLIIRDMMLRGARTYKEFMECYEGIATNILAGSPAQADRYGLSPRNQIPRRRKLIYLLTAKGIDLAPVMTEMVLWAAAHEDTVIKRSSNNARGQGKVHRWSAPALGQFAIHSVANDSVAIPDPLFAPSSPFQREPT